MLLGLMGAALLATAFSTFLPSATSAASLPTSQADCTSSQYFEAANPVTNQPAKCVNKVDAPKSATDCPSGYIYQPVSTPPKCIVTSAKACTSSQYFVAAKPVANQPAKCVNKVDNPRNASDCPSGYTYKAGSGAGTMLAQPATCVASAKACTSSQYFVAAKPAEGPIPPTAAKCVNKVDNPRNASDCPSGYDYQKAFGTNGATCLVSRTTQTGGCTNGTDSNGNCNASSNDALDCGSGALNWIVCSVIQGAQSAANTLDSFITSQLNVDASGIFEKTTVQNSNSNGYYTAWNSFRIISMALLIIAGLVMVASQALGFEALDAYTVRKTLPRLLVAIIGISLSWPLMDFVVQFFDTLGHDVGNLIYYPFNHLASNISVQAGLSTILIAGAAVLVLGFASLTFILTGLLAMFVAFITLVIRQVALIILVILAPIGIACYVLPGTQKVWKLWRENFLGLLLMFPIVMAFIAAGHVFSAVSLNAGAGNSPASTVTQLVGILGYFIPYFMLPLAFRMATGAVGNIAGFVNDRHKGAFDRLKGVRSNAMQKNMANMKTGTRFNNRGLNALTSHATTSRFGLGARGRAAYNQKMDLAAMEFAKSNPGQALQHNDLALRAMTYGSEIEAKHNMARDFGMTVADVDKGIVAARAAGGFGRTRQIWAAQQLSNTATGYDNLEQVGATIARVSHGNEGQIESLAGNINSGTKAVGRPDLAPGFSDLAALAKAESRHDATADAYTLAHLRAAGAMDGLSTMRGKPAEVKAVANNLTARLRTHPGDEVNELKLHEMINGFSYGNSDSQNHLIRAIRGGTDEKGNVVLGLDPNVGNNKQIIDHLERTLEAVKQGRNGYDPNNPGGTGSGAPKE